MNEFITNTTARLEEEIAARRSMIDWLNLHHDRFNGIESVATMHIANWIDFDNLPHAEIIEVIKAFPGKWNKTPSHSRSDRIDYTTEFDGVRLRCWHGVPPPSCKIVEVLEEIQPQPATTRLVRKLVCKEPESEPAAESAL